MELENARLTAGHDALRLKDHKNEEALKDLNHQVSKLKAEVGQRDKGNELLLVKIEQLDGKVEDAKQKLELSEQDLESCAKKLKSSEKKLKSSEQKLESAEQKLKTFKQRVKVFVNEI
jgi:chromosome segregation ATPase